MHVALFSVAPTLHDALCILHHCLCVCHYARAVEGRLHQPPLPQPEITFASEQPFPKNVAVRPQDPAFVVPARMADQYLFNEVGVIDENVAKIDDADADDVPVASQFGKHFQRALAQRAKGPAFEPAVRPGGKFVAAEPHSTMLSRALMQVNAAETPVGRRPEFGICFPENLAGYRKNPRQSAFPLRLLDQGAQTYFECGRRDVSSHPGYRMQ